MMTLLRIFICSFIFFLGTAGACCWGQDNFSQPSPGSVPYEGGVSTTVRKAPMLQGGIEHSVQLPPVQTRLHVGATFDEGLLEKPLPSIVWYRVPLWMAGKWEYDLEYIYSNQDYKTGVITPGGQV